MTEPYVSASTFKRGIFFYMGLVFFALGALFAFENKTNTTFLDLSLELQTL